MDTFNQAREAVVALYADEHLNTEQAAEQLKRLALEVDRCLGRLEHEKRGVMFQETTLDQLKPGDSFVFKEGSWPHWIADDGKVQLAGIANGVVLGEENPKVLKLMAPRAYKYGPSDDGS